MTHGKAVPTDKWETYLAIRLIEEVDAYKSRKRQLVINAKSHM